MISDLLRRLASPTPERLPEPDARTALAALLVRIARSDRQYGGDETGRIDRILARRYGLAPPEAAALRREAEEIEAEAPDTVRFTRALKDAVPSEDRESLMEALWAVVVTDGARDPEEDALLRTVAPLLGVSDRDSNMARQRAEAAQPPREG